jgi:hypothetical protein
MARFRIRRALTTSAILGALATAGLSARHAPSAKAAMGTTGTAAQQTLTAGPYTLTLRIGPLEQMYTQDQVKKTHPKRGEVMLRGTMAMGGMGSAMPNHHLELHVYLRSSHAVVTNAMVAITVETPSGKVVTRVPIAVMRGVTASASDIHYGNNVLLMADTYTVVVKVEQTTAIFMISLGESSMSM